jgi:ComF family protein
VPTPRVIARLLELVYPPRCPACDAPRPAADALCGACALSLYPVGVACPRCAEPLAGPVAHLCRRCATAAPPLARAVAAYRYGGQLAVALRRLKYQRRADIARDLAPLFAATLRPAAADADLVVPIPLHWTRLSQRGFNQAQLLAVACGIRVAPFALSRTRRTPSQAGRTARERAANVRGAFAVAPGRRGQVAGAHVLLVDDVMTTGATANAAARALLDAGAARASCACLARADD